MAWTEQSVGTVRRAVPLTWPGRVVFYALSSPRLLRGMGTRFLDRAAIAFPVYDDPRRPTRRVATRVVINPRYLPRTERQGTYLLSHELTHVALARTNGGTPVVGAGGARRLRRDPRGVAGLVAAVGGLGGPGAQGRRRDARQHVLRRRRPGLRVRPLARRLRGARRPVRHRPAVEVPAAAVRGRLRRRGRRGAHRRGPRRDVRPGHAPAGPRTRPGWSSPAVPDGHATYANRYLEGRALLTVMGFNDQVFVRRATLGDLIAHEETPHVPHPTPPPADRHSRRGRCHHPRAGRLDRCRSRPGPGARRGREAAQAEAAGQAERQAPDPRDQRLPRPARAQHLVLVGRHQRHPRRRRGVPRDAPGQGPRAGEVQRPAQRDRRRG